MMPLLYMWLGSEAHETALAEIELQRLRREEPEEEADG
jgi:hypothetical protein